LFQGSDKNSDTNNVVSFVYPKDQGEYMISHAFPIVGNVEYRKEFGGGTLSHNNWITVLEEWCAVCEVVGLVMKTVKN
jgi:hypothetical protein